MAVDNFEISSTTIQVPVGICALAISSFSYAESFENTIGDWTQNTNDDFDWTVTNNTTPSVNTGPSTAAEGGYYAYMESSAPNYSFKNAQLIGPCFDLSLSNPIELSFSNHLNGAANMGGLQLDISTDGGINWVIVWPQIGNQGDSWQNAVVDLSNYRIDTAVQFRSKATTVATWQVHMGIDYFLIAAIPTISCYNANMILNFDSYPEETRWEIAAATGTLLASEGSYANQADGSSLQLIECSYTLTVIDTYDDGLCCAYGTRVLYIK